MPFPSRKDQVRVGASRIRLAMLLTRWVVNLLASTTTTARTQNTVAKEYCDSVLDEAAALVCALIDLISEQCLRAGIKDCEVPRLKLGPLLPFWSEQLACSLMMKSTCSSRLRSQRIYIYTYTQHAMPIECTVAALQYLDYWCCRRILDIR